MTTAVITLHTYAKGENNHTSDSTEFTVPLNWLRPIIKEEYGMSVKSFLDSYTWDDSEMIMVWAKEANVLQE